MHLGKIGLIINSANRNNPTHPTHLFLLTKIDELDVQIGIVLPTH